MHIFIVPVVPVVPVPTELPAWPVSLAPLQEIDRGWWNGPADNLKKLRGLTQRAFSGICPISICQKSIKQHSIKPQICSSVFSCICWGCQSGIMRQWILWIFKCDSSETESWSSKDQAPPFNQWAREWKHTLISLITTQSHLLKKLRVLLRVRANAGTANARTLNKWVPARVITLTSQQAYQNGIPSTSLLTKEEIWQEVCHVLIELILRGQQHRLVVNEQQQQVEEEEQHDAGEHHQDSRDAVLLGNDTCFGVQWLQQVRQTCANAIALWQWVTLSIGCRLLGISDREVALWGLHRHTHLAVLASRVHEAHLAAQRPHAQASSKGVDP